MCHEVQLECYKHPKIYFQEQISSLIFICTLSYYLYTNTLLVPCLPQMAPKKRQSLAESRRKIEAERVQTVLRTEQRIERLYADAGRSSELVLQKWHGCLNTFCTLLTLFCMILLYYYYQWLYYKKSTVTVTKV